MELNGAGKIVYTVDENASLILNPTLGGIAIIQGETMRGEPGKPKFVANWQAFLREFGGYHPDSNFPVYMKIMLDAGAKFWVGRLFHFTDVDDIDTAEGTKATGQITDGAANDVDITAKAVGVGYNGITVTTRAAISGAAAKFDILVDVGNDDVVQEILDVSETPGVSEIADVNAQLKNVDIAVTGDITAGTATLAGGVQDITDIIATDYNGSQVSVTGLYQFGVAKNAFRLVNVKADPDVDVAYANFARATMRFKAELGVPIGANYSGMDDYRNGGGAYDHTPVNDWLATFTGGDLKVVDPRNSKLTLDIPGIVAAIGNKLVKDASGRPWLSAATLPEFGTIRTANRGVNFDLNAPENVANYDLISKTGFNVITNDETFGSVYHGNDSAILNRTTILQHENVADLILYILKNLPQYVKTSQWRPNDPQMWEALYLKVLPFITQTLVAGRAIRPTQNKDWFWIGDQDVDDYRDAVFNSLAAIDAGKYKARFVFIPIPATKFIGIDFVPTDSNSIAAVVRDDLN